MTSLPPPIASALATSLTAQKQLLKPNQRLDAAIANCERNSIPPIAVGPSQGHFLSILCKMINAQSVLEIGTLGGYSTIWFAESVPGVHVTSIEFNPKHRDVALENVKGLGNVDILLGAALDVLPKLAEEGKVFDVRVLHKCVLHACMAGLRLTVQFVFIDADWDEQREYFDWAVKLTRKGGCVYVDNVVRQLTESEEGDPRGWALIDHVKADERVEATMIPTLSTHKVEMDELVDGFVLANVK